MSRERLTLPAGLVSFRAAAPKAAPGAPAAPAAPPAEVPATGGAGGLSVAELKELQRRAFERGAAAARAELAAKFDAAFADLRRAKEACERERRAERDAAGPFAVELALGLADEVVGATLRDGRHDVRGLVETAVDEALPLADGSPLVAELHPEDLARLEQILALRPLAAGAVVLRANPSAPRGSCRVAAGGAEVACDPAERMRAAAARVRAEAARRFAEDSHDAL